MEYIQESMAARIIQTDAPVHFPVFTNRYCIEAVVICYQSSFCNFYNRRKIKIFTKELAFIVM